MASGPLKKRFRSILRRTLFHPTNWENHVETRKKRKRTSKTRTRARPRRRRRRCRFRTKETRRHSMPRLDFVFFGRKGAFSLGRLRHTRMKRMHDVTTVRSLICFTKKKRENEDAKPRAREDARPAEEGNANANAYLALFSTRREQTKERNHRVRDASMMCASSLNRE